MGIRLDADLKTTVTIMQPSQKQIQKNNKYTKTKQKHVTGKTI